MYPFIRYFWKLFRAMRQPPLEMGAVQEVTIRALPWDIDPFGDLNNGRTLTFYDAGRLTLVVRSKIHHAMRENDWFMTVAGASVQYRRRVFMFEKLTIRTRIEGYDARFLYFRQEMLRKGEATSQGIYRIALANKDGIVNPAKLMAAMGCPDWNPALPEWIANWSSAEGTRPWPPEK